MRSDGLFADGRSADTTRNRRISASADPAANISLQERERVRIGFDLHDGPAQTMSAALLQIKMLDDAEGEELKLGLRELRATLAIALEETYELIESLRGHGAPDDSLVSRVTACVESFAARSGIEPTLVIEGTMGFESPSLQIAVFRIVQEALSNVARHSGAKRVDVRLEMSPSGLACEVADDGRGFAMGEVLSSRRNRDPYGLYSMRERARMLDGDCSVESAPGRGTRVRVEIPVWRA